MAVYMGIMGSRAFHHLIDKGWKCVGENYYLGGAGRGMQGRRLGLDEVKELR